MLVITKKFEGREVSKIERDNLGAQAELLVRLVTEVDDDPRFTLEISGTRQQEDPDILQLTATAGRSDSLTT